MLQEALEESLPKTTENPAETNVIQINAANPATPSLTLSPDSLIVIDASESFMNALGLRRSDLVGRSILPWVGAEEREDFRRTVRMAGRHPLPSELSFHWKTSNGRTLAMEITAWILKLSTLTQVIELSARPKRGTIDGSLPIPSSKPLAVLKTVG